MHHSNNFVNGYNNTNWNQGQGQYQRFYGQTYPYALNPGQGPMYQQNPRPGPLPLPPSHAAGRPHLPPPRHMIPYIQQQPPPPPPPSHHPPQSSHYYQQQNGYNQPRPAPREPSSLSLIHVKPSLTPAFQPQNGPSVASPSTSIPSPASVSSHSAFSPSSMTINHSGQDIDRKIRELNATIAKLQKNLGEIKAERERIDEEERETNSNLLKATQEVSNLKHMVTARGHERNEATSTTNGTTAATQSYSTTSATSTTTVASLSYIIPSGLSITPANSAPISRADVLNRLGNQGPITSSAGRAAPVVSSQLSVNNARPAHQPHQNSSNSYNESISNVISAALRSLPEQTANTTPAGSAASTTSSSLSNSGFNPLTFSFSNRLATATTSANSGLYAPPFNSLAPQTQSGTTGSSSFIPDVNRFVANSSNNISQRLISRGKDLNLMKSSVNFEPLGLLFECFADELVKSHTFASMFKINFKLTGNQVASITGYEYPQISTNQRRILVRCCLLDRGKSVHSDCITSDIVVKLNNQIVFIGTNRKHTLKWPLDVTSNCNLDGSLNTLEISTMNGSTNGITPEYGACVVLAQRLSLTEALNNLSHEKYIRSEPQTKQVVRNMFKTNSDIASESIKIALTCPISKQKLEIPCFGADCEHLNCFNAKSFIEMNRNKTEWICPLCRKPIGLDQLRVDGLISKVLRECGPNCRQVEFDINGDWKAVDEKDSKVDTKKTTVIDDQGPTDFDCITIGSSDDEDEQEPEEEPEQDEAQDEEEEEEEEEERFAFVPSPDMAPLSFSPLPEVSPQHEAPPVSPLGTTNSLSSSSSESEDLNVNVTQMKQKRLVRSTRNSSSTSSRRPAKRVLESDTSSDDSSKSSSEEETDDDESDVVVRPPVKTNKYIPEKDSDEEEEAEESKSSADSESESEEEEIYSPRNKRLRSSIPRTAKRARGGRGNQRARRGR